MVRGLEAVKTILHRHPDLKRPDAELLQLLEICLTHNDFLFDGQYYLQMQGTAMGHKYAPSYANIYMSEWEQGALSLCDIQPAFYKRYLDDIIGIWSHELESFKTFFQTLNNYHPSIKLKHNLQLESINFLDTTLFFHTNTNGEKQILSRVFFKPTDTHALLYKTSYHPVHTFKGIVKSQIIRFSRICSKESDLFDAISILFKTLRRRGYSRSFLRKVEKDTLTKVLGPKPQPTDIVLSAQMGQGNDNNEGPIGPDVALGVDATHIIPLVTNFYQPHFHFLNQLKQNFQNKLQSSPSFSNSRVLTAFRRNKNLKDHLVHARFSREPQTQVDLLDKYFCSIKTIYNPHGNRSCLLPNQYHKETKNIVYCIICTTCKKLYVGETHLNIRTRLKQHLYTITKKSPATELVKHFNIHSSEGLQITILEAGPNWSVRQRRTKERNWIHVLQTKTPLGLNEK